MMEIERIQTLVGVLTLIFSSLAGAVDVNIVGLFAGKALLEINKAPARMVSVGQKINGVKLLEANSARTDQDAGPQVERPRGQGHGHRL